MLYDINFVSWRRFQTIQKRRNIVMVCLLSVVLFLGIECYFFIVWQGKVNVLNILMLSHKTLSERNNELNKRESKDVHIEKRQQVITHVLSDWSNARWQLYVFIDALKQSTNASITIDNVSQVANVFVLDGECASLDKFNQFIDELKNKSIVSVVDVESIKVQFESNKPHRFRVQIHTMDFIPNRGI